MCGHLVACCAPPTCLPAANRVVEFLQKVDPDAAKRAQARYQCFDR